MWFIYLIRNFRIISLNVRGHWPFTCVAGNYLFIFLQLTYFSSADVFFNINRIWLWYPAQVLAKVAAVAAAAAAAAAAVAAETAQLGRWRPE
jgi:hypothetical protein